MVVIGRSGDSQDWLQRINGMRQWKRGDERAPHKPLLLLYALGRLQNDRTSRISYKHSESQLKGLIRDFGPPRKYYRPEYPFTKLPNDGLWEVTAKAGAKVRTNRKALIDSGTVGQFKQRDEEALLADPQLLYTTARKLLFDNWPDSLHADICNRVGLTLGILEQDLAQLRLDAEGIRRPDSSAGETTQSTDASDASGTITGKDSLVKTRRRDPRFREQVLLTYEYRCAMCGWDGRIDNTTVGLEAAHLWWHSHGGPEDPQNGLSLCVLHHKLLDRGALGLTNNRRILVSQHFVARGPTATAVTALSGQKIRPPQVPENRPHPDHIEWHKEQVFRKPARIAPR